MPTLAPTTIGPVTMVPVVLGPTTLGSTGTVTTLVQLPPASAFTAGPDVAYYWVGRDGGAATNYSNARLVLGTTDYVYWTLDGEGHDPGLDDPALDGLTGHVVALVGGNRTAAQVATATAAVVDALDGWSCTADDDTLEIDGPAAITTGVAWDDATTGSMVGMRSITGTHEGPISNALGQYLPSPGLDLPLLAVDILIGSVADNTDRWRGVLYAGVGGSATPVGESRTIDLGRLPAAQVVANGWARWYVPPSSNIRGTAALWLGVKGTLGITTVRGVLSGNSLRGDWPSANLLRSDQGEPSPINPDASVAWPSTWTGAIAVESGFVMGVRLIYGSATGDASYHSAADPAIFGTHVEPATLGSVIDLDSRLFMVAPAPPFLGMVVGGEGWAVGDARGTQPRIGVVTGGSAVEPVNPNGATVLADGGRLTGSSTDAWEDRTHAPVAWTASVATAWAAKCNDDTTGTRIRFAQDPEQDQASPPEAPMDWLAVSSDPGPTGSEYEEFGADNDPATTFVTPYVAPVSPARPRNVPGARILWWIPGITIAS